MNCCDNGNVKWYSLLLTLYALLAIAPTVVALPAAAPPFSSVVALESIDPGAFASYVGTDSSSTAELPKDGARHVLWTANSAPEWDGVTFGNSKTAGPRYLRIGFRSAMPVGTVITRGAVQVSVLKATGAYPGVPSDESQWISAVRLSNHKITREEPHAEDYAIWVLPPGTRSRALRFTHTAVLTDTHYAGWLGGAYLVEGRYANIAPQAIAASRTNNEKAVLLNDESNNGTWGAWDNGEERELPVSAAAPEWITLTWRRAVTLTGLNAVWAGFGACDVERFEGTANRPASEADWKAVGSYASVKNQYPRSLGLNWLAFDRAITTTAIRLRITQATTEDHPHLQGKTRAGKRIWLGELMALQPLGMDELSSAVPPLPTVKEEHPPIPIRFHLAHAGRVTLVIEDSHGMRVRNLLADTPFPAGDNTAWWDGTDDLGRDTEAARHGLYHIPAAFVAPGRYRVRGLVHDKIELHYEFSVYSGGNPVWETADHTGGWLANHTPPSSTLFLPAKRAGEVPRMLVGSYVTEGGSGLAWLDLNGKKLDGRGWIGGAWTGAPFLARDDGPMADPDVYAYVGAAWGELRLTALLKGGETAVLNPTFKFPGAPQDDHNPNSAISGLAACNGYLVAALPKLNEIMVIDAIHHRLAETVPISDPRGLSFDSQGRLVILSGTRLIRCCLAEMPVGGTLPLPSAAQIVVGLDDPQGVTVGKNGDIYISVHGAHHQVLVYSDKGAYLRAIGRPGPPEAGAYDPLHMNHPLGISIDSNEHLWVAENDFQPKRVSVWTLDGKLVNAYYGPSEYGGGGTLDPHDKSRFYFHGMEFRLDWKTGANQLVDVFFRPGEHDLSYPDGFGVGGPPETPLYAHGQQYMTNCYNSNPTNGAGIAMLWMMKDGIAHPVAAMGRANDWSLLKSEPFRQRWPQGVDLKGDMWQNQAVFLWSDTNGDGQMQPDEVTLWRGAPGGITVMPDLSFVAARVNDRAMRYSPTRFTSGGVPVYDPALGIPLLEGAQGPVSSGGDQALVGPDGWTLFTNAPKPFSPYGLGGARNGKAIWSYPSLWPGLHASHEAPAPEFSGELIGTTRLLGGVVRPTLGDAGPLWCINGNMGDMYLFTADGLFVSQLLQDVRQGATWTMPTAQRNMLVNNLTMHDENFWPSITQTADGNIYLNASHPSLVRVDGLNSVRRLPEFGLSVTATDLKNAQSYLVRSELERQKLNGAGTLVVSTRSSPPTIGTLQRDWSSTQFVTIDKRGVAANFDSNSRPYNVTAAAAICGDRLYVLYRTGDKDLLKNSGEVKNALFKTGGALDLMLNCVEGGERLLVTRVTGKTAATLYRPHLPGAKVEPTAFSSPWRTIKMDLVQDVSSQIELTSDESGNYLISAPLTLIGLNKETAAHFKGDIGVLRGNGFQTVQRVYWSNKATSIVADVPSEAELTPALWGNWELAK